MSKKKLIIIGVSVIVLIISYALFGDTADENKPITVEVTKGKFMNEVIISGEAQSTSSKEINGPDNAMRHRIYNLKIQDLVAEGTIVKKGDYIGKLDPSEVNGKINDAMLNLESAESRYTQQHLDTILTLKQERNAIKDLLFKIEENKLELTRSIYEPPSTVRQLEITIEKNERDLKEKKEDYSIKKRQANAKMIQVGTEVSKIKKQIEEYNSPILNLISHCLQMSFRLHQTDLPVPGLLNRFSDF
jgi:multidrug efflux pump subunit AcrA (membrane-fusion protein)